MTTETGQPTEKSEATQQSIVPRLFAATDYVDGCGSYSEECWWIAVWAENEEQALKFAKEHYTESDEVESVSIQHVMECKEYVPDSWPKEECRCKVLREMGWRSEGETSCDHCGLYALDYKHWSVCDDCCRCPECAEHDATDDKCENCGL